MPKTIQDAVATARLQEEFALVGGFNLKLDETVVPVTIIKDIEVSNWRDCFVGDLRGLAGAGVSHKWMLRNPADSGILAECYEIGMNCSLAGMDWRMFVEDPPFVPGTVVATSFQDLAGEFGTPQSFPACNFQTAASAAIPAGTVVFTTVTNAGITWVYQPRIILHPGQSFILWQSGNNQNGNVWMQWRERPLRTTEQR